VRSYLKLGAVGAILGVLLAAAVSFALPARYLSTAALRSTTPSGAALAQIRAAGQELLSPATLTEFINNPKFNLYPDERRRLPMEDVNDAMRADLKVKTDLADPRIVRLSFQYPDPHKARAVVSALTSRFVAQAGLDNLVILENATIPAAPSEPDRLRLTALGLAAGLALGILAAYLRRRPLRWILAIAAAGVFGTFAAFEITSALQESFTSDRSAFDFVVLGGLTALAVRGFLTRARPATGNRSLRFAFRAAIAGALVNGFVSFALPERFVSTAILRANVRGAATLPPGAISDRLQEVQAETLSRSSLGELIERPSLDLYRNERTRRPLEDVIQEMRTRAIRIAPQSAPGLSSLFPAVTFQIAFEYPDAKKAQIVVRELVTKHMEQNVAAERRVHPDFWAEDSIILEVVEPASLPEIPVSPNRYALVAFGLAGGAVLGLLAAGLGRPSRRALKFSFAGAAAGAVIAAVIAFTLPDRYASTAVLRLRPPAADRERAAELLDEGVAELLSPSGLSEIILYPKVGLYRRERAHKPIAEVARLMHDDLRIEPAELSPTGRTTAIRIRFEYPDAAQAAAGVQQVVNRFVELRPGQRLYTGIALAEPPSVPQSPVSPNRPLIAAAGLMAGLLAGLAIHRFTSPRNCR
jgi:succinoglycan biosynthesis transport protein ExoP